MKIKRILSLLLICGCSAEVAPTPAPTAVPIVEPDEPEVPPEPVSSLPALRPAPALDAWEWTNGSGPPNLGGKPAIVEFWATWCTPCLRSTPHIVDLARKYKAQGLVTVGIHVETHIDEEAVDSFISAFAVPYPIGFDRQGTVHTAFNVGETIPKAYVIAHTGDIVWEGNPLSEKERFEEVVAQVVADATK